jgi:cell division protein FtsA
MSRAKEEKNLIIGLDIGTSKVVAIVAELMADGSMDVIGLGQHLSRGLKKGVVINIDSTVFFPCRERINKKEICLICKIFKLW